MSELPSMEDRKRFLNCLACILASSYDYGVYNNDTYYLASFVDSPSYNELDDEIEIEGKGKGEIENSDDRKNERMKEQQQQSLPLSFKKKNPPNELKKSKSSLSSPPPKRSQSKLEIEMENMEAAIRQRYYITAWNLLVSGANCLFPDKRSDIMTAEEEAQRLLPMLSQLLQPPSPSSSPLACDPFEINSKNELLFLANDDQDDDNNNINKHNICQTNLSSMSNGAGFQCLSLLLFQHLISAKTGYDARARHVFKKLGVAVLAYQDDDYYQNQNQDQTNTDSSNVDCSALVAKATRKFECLEHAIAVRLLGLAAAPKAKSDSNSNDQTAAAADDNDASSSSPPKNKTTKFGGRFSRKQLVRGLKVGTAGIVAGTLLVVTGGLAAPGIAVGLSALGMGAVAGTFLTLASSAAVLSIFGAAGGSLAAYKMNRRTAGLTEFEIRQEVSSGKTTSSSSNNSKTQGAELFRTICMSGWLGDACDFQRPWGVLPTHPPLVDKLELLERFYQIENPALLPDAKYILQRWEGKENLLWKLLESKYGKDPDHLFPLKPPPSSSSSSLGPRLAGGALTVSEVERLDKLIILVGELGGGSKKSGKAEPFNFNLNKRKGKQEQIDDPKKNSGSDTASTMAKPIPNTNSRSASEFEVVCLPPNSKEEGDKAKYERPKHLSTVWDYKATYGGELYTVKWESKLLLDISDSVKSLAYDLVGSGTKGALQLTVASTLLVAAALPTTVYSALSSIDGTWTLAIERSQEAGRELARSLLFNRAGHRPVTLVGYSFGARAIYYCLKELVRYQEQWEALPAAEKIGGDSGTQRFPKKSSSSAGNITDEKLECEPASIIEDVILMGAPVYLNLPTWRKCRQLVAGRLINVYSRKDRMLSYMFKYKSMITGGLRPVCGTCTVAVPGVENVDVSDIIRTHQEYYVLQEDILHRIRHAQPVKSLSNVVDEMALIAQAEQELSLDEDTRSMKTKC